MIQHVSLSPVMSLVQHVIKGIFTSVQLHWTWLSVVSHRETVYKTTDSQGTVKPLTIFFALVFLCLKDNAYSSMLRIPAEGLELKTRVFVEVKASNLTNRHFKLFI